MLKAIKEAYNEQPNEVLAGVAVVVMGIALGLAAMILNSVITH